MDYQLISLITSTLQDSHLKMVFQDLLQNADSHPGFTISKGCLWYEERLILPRNSPRIPIVLVEIHSTPGGGHSGVVRTYKRDSFCSVLEWYET